MMRLSVSPELRFLLPMRLRGNISAGSSTGMAEVPYDPTATLGHVVQAAGIPLTEVGELQVDGQPASPSRRSEPEDLVGRGARATRLDRLVRQYS